MDLLDLDDLIRKKNNYPKEIRKIILKYYVYVPKLKETKLFKIFPEDYSSYKKYLKCTLDDIDIKTATSYIAKMHPNDFIILHQVMYTHSEGFTSTTIKRVSSGKAIVKVLESPREWLLEEYPDGSVHMYKHYEQDEIIWSLKNDKSKKGTLTYNCGDESSEYKIIVFNVTPEAKKIIQKDFIEKYKVGTAKKKKWHPVMIM